MTLRNTLIEARNLISDPKNWTINVGARDIEGNSAFPESPHAVCWCALGALKRASPSAKHFRAGLHLLDVTSKNELAQINILDVNDRLGHEAVLQVYDAAIESLS